MKNKVSVAIIVLLTAMLVFPIVVSLAAGNGDMVHRIDKNIQTPVIKTKVNPTYPEDARKAKEQGVVVIEAVIDTAGKVKDAKVLKGAHELLNAAALDAVNQWEYEPARFVKNGQPVSVYLTITVAFRLNGDKEEK